MDESYTFKKYLLGLAEQEEYDDIFYYKPATIFIDCRLPGNFVIEINKEYPLSGVTKFIASLIDAKFGTTILTCFLSEDEYYMFHKAARNYQTKRGKQIENQLKSILEQWKKDEFYDRDKM